LSQQRKQQCEWKSDQVKAVRTLSFLRPHVFDAFCRAAKRRGQDPRVESGTKSFVLYLDDASFLEPFVGTHRVQRIPKNSTRRHTSTATIVILDGMESILSLTGSNSKNTFHFDEADLSETYARGDGPGGQHRNKTNSCVVLTHVPTGVTVRIDGRSQWQNRQEARRVLSDRIAALKGEESANSLNAQRRSQINSERSAKTFTHNEQRDEVVDHQTGRKWRMTDFAKGKF
jgi:peptide chain release factor 1